MHCEDFELIEGEQRDPSLRHELPKRVFLCREKAPSSVPFCDYVFHGDDPADCLQAFDEILGKQIAWNNSQRPENRTTKNNSFNSILTLLYILMKKLNLYKL